MSGYQEKLHAEGLRLLERLGLQDVGATNPLPPSYGFFHLIPALHAIVDRLDKLELADKHPEWKLAQARDQQAKLEAQAGQAKQQDVGGIIGGQRTATFDEIEHLTRTGEWPKDTA